MRSIYSCFLVVTLLMFAGCTNVRVEGDAHIFESSGVGSVVRIVIGVGLLAFGIVSVIANILYEGKSKNRNRAMQSGLTTTQRVCLGIFSCGMAFAGFCLIVVSFLIKNKLHVTVYPDRVALASTYAQTGGRETVIPFSNVSSVEVRDEVDIIGKSKPHLVFTLKDGKTIKQEAGNNERAALETIQQALADYKPPQVAAPPKIAGNETPMKNSVASNVPPKPPTGEQTSTNSNPPPSDPTRLNPNRSGAWEIQSPSSATNGATTATNGATTANPTTSKYSLKRYPIKIAVPAGSSIVAADTEVKVGMKLGACYSGKWESVTVVELNSDGTITCSWDNWKGFIYKMMREDLTIPKTR